MSRRCARLGVHVFVVSGTNVGNIDGQLGPGRAGPGRLHLCLNRGSEVFEVGADGPELRWRRTATTTRERALDRAADQVVEQLATAGSARSGRFSTAEPPQDRPHPRTGVGRPPKARIGELLDAVTTRLRAAGWPVSRGRRDGDGRGAGGGPR